MPYPGKYSKSASTRSVNKAVYNNGKRSLAAERRLVNIARNEISKVVNVEYKHHGASTGFTTVNPSVVYLLNGIGEGDGASNRDGRQIKLTSIGIRGMVQMTGSASPTVMRISVVRVNFLIGGTFGASDFLSGTNGGSDTAIFEFNDTDEQKNYTTLHNEWISLGDEGAFGSYKMFEWYKQYKDGWHVQYNTGTAVESAVSHGALFLVVSTNHSGASPPQMSFQSRIRYIDN